MGELQKFLISTQKSVAAVILQWTTDQTSLCTGYCDAFGLADAHLKFFLGTALFKFCFSSR